METPHLDEVIEQLKGLYERVGAKSTKEKLQEYEAIKEALSIHDVSDCKKLNIHECLNDLEKVIEVKTGVLDFIDKGSLRYQLKKAIDKMICCR